MTAKEYLNQAYNLDQRIQSKHRQINMLKDREAMFSSATTSGANEHSPLGDAACKYIELQIEIADEIMKFCNLQKEIAGVIAQVENDDYKTLLEYYYLSFCQWEEVALRMGYSYRHVTRLHGEALKKVKHVLECPIKSVI